MRRERKHAVASARGARRVKQAKDGLAIAELISQLRQKARVVDAPVTGNGVSLTRVEYAALMRSLAFKLHECQRLMLDNAYYVKEARKWLGTPPS